MLTRRRFVGYSALSSAMLAYRPLLRFGLGQTPAEPAQRPLRLAILGSVYRQGSDMQTIADRFLVGYPYEGEWRIPNVQVVSVYVDQQARRAEAAPSAYQLAMTGARVAQGGLSGRGAAGAQGSERAAGARRSEAVQPPEELGPMSDLSQARSQQFGFRLCRNIPEALRCGGDRIAVDAVLTLVEQGDYPSNDKGQILLPGYDFFQQCAQVFEEEGHAVPYFNHKQLSFSFDGGAEHGEDRQPPEIPAIGRLLDARYLALAGRGYTAGRGGARGGNGGRGRLRRHGFRRA